MSEKLIKEVEFQEHKLKIYWGRPFELKDKDVCSIYVRSKSDDYILFIERTYIHEDAEFLAKNYINDRFFERFPEDKNQWGLLIKKITDYTFENAKDRIEKKNYKGEGEIYKEEISLSNIEQWLDIIKWMFEE